MFSLIHRRSALAALFYIVLLPHVVTVAAEKPRTWSDKTGKYKVEATLKAVTNGKAILLRANGDELQIDVAKLSAADQKYLQDNPPVDEDNPFQPAEKMPAKAASPAAPKEAKVDWTDVQTVAQTPTADGWKFAVPIEGRRAAPLKNRAVALPPKSNFFESVAGMTVNHGTSHALIGYVLGEPKPVGTTRIVLCDFEQGKILLKAETSGQMAPVAINDDGTQVLMRRAEWGHGKADRLELWNLNAQGITKTLQWVPYEDAQGGNRDIKWGAFLADNRFLTLGASGRLALWKSDSAEPIYSMQVDGGSVPALTPDRQYLAFSTGQQIGVLDINAGEVVALQSTPRTPWPQLCFNPDGTRLALVAHGKILVWNFGDGSLHREISLAGTNVHASEIAWPHPNYMLLAKSYLFDIENQVRLWSYHGGEAVASVAPGQCGFIVSAGTDKPGALVLGPVPTPAFEKALAAAQKQPDFFVLKPGTTVKLSLESLQDAQERERVREALTQKLKERDCKVGPQGTIELVATAEAGEESEVSYHGFGLSPFQKYKVRAYISKLAFVYQGKVTWQVQGTSVPGFIQLKQGETVEQVLRRSERPNYQFFQHAELPTILMKPTNADGLGSSQVSVTGVQ